MDVEDLSGNSACNGSTSSGEDDPVVKEIPVFLNRLHDPPHMCGEVYVMLDTMRPLSRPYGDQGQLTSVELDDENSRIRINYSLNTRTDTYDPVSAHPLRKHSLVGKPMPRDDFSGTYCMGIMSEGVMTLVPVTSICTMRPSFDHVDEEASSRKTGLLTKSEEGGSNEAKPLTGKALHYQQLVKSVKANKSHWRTLDHYDYDSVEAADLLHEHILVSTLDRSHGDRQHLHDLKTRELEFVSGTQGEYLTALTSGRSKASTIESAVVDQTELSRLEFGRQVEAIMKRCQVLRFSDLLNSLPANTRARYSPVDIVAQLDHCALLIQGNWVVLSHLSGLRPQLWDTRDALLILLHADREVTVQLLSGINNLGKDDIEELLRTVCSLDLLTNTWKLKLREDKEYIQSHPDIVQRHSAIANSIIQRLKAKKERSSSSSSGQVTAGSGKAFTAEETRAMMEIARSKLIDFGASTTDEIRQAIQAQTRDHFVSDSSALEILRLVEAVPVRDRWAANSRGKDDVLRFELISLYKDRDALTKPEIVAAFNKVLGRVCDLTDHDLRKLIKEFARNEKGYWVFNGEPIAERRIKTVKDEVDDIVMR
jgi:hypothetical protein